MSVSQENIEAYLHACQDLGMAVTDCFPVVDLFEERDTNSVRFRPWSVS